MLYISGSNSCKCCCPKGFGRYGARCLLVLDQPVMTWAEAAKRCAALGAHLAVPRSEAENDHVKLAAVNYQTGERQMAWLGMEEIGSERVFKGADGCGNITQHFWADWQPDNMNWPEPAVAYAPPDMWPAHYTGWHTQSYENGPHRPLCQLSYCYRPDCQ